MKDPEDQKPQRHAKMFDLLRNRPAKQTDAAREKYLDPKSGDQFVARGLSSFQAPKKDAKPGPKKTGRFGFFPANRQDS